MMCLIVKERIALGTQVEGTRGEVFAASPIAFQSRCKRVPNEPIPTDGPSWPSTPECSLKIWHRQSEEQQWNIDGMAICNATLGIDTGRRVRRHWDVSDGSDRPLPLWLGHSAQTELSFADEPAPKNWPGLAWNHPWHNMFQYDRLIWGMDIWCQNCFIPGEWKNHLCMYSITQE
jgi:hypothetical protein